jgi:hypothetical protein
VQEVQEAQMRGAELLYESEEPELFVLSGGCLRPECVEDPIPKGRELILVVSGLGCPGREWPGLPWS